MRAGALVIDDDRDNRELLAEFLESAGYPVICCGTAAAAEKVLEERGRPGVVVSDVRLPDMLGPTFVSQMKSRPGFEDTPVIFVTGLTPSDAHPIADPVLINPFDVEVLISLVDRYCGAPRLVTQGAPGT